MNCWACHYPKASRLPSHAVEETRSVLVFKYAMPNFNSYQETPNFELNAQDFKVWLPAPRVQ
ncbi:MAG: hypothetical protein H0W58_13505 [Acidobacteria bacterium]|nr:hypothetical protein [Acidobacteriota bacterium]